jgi:hypothetical protein
MTSGHRRALAAARYRAFKEGNERWPLPVSGTASGVESMRTCHIDGQLANELITHFEFVAGGGLPTAENAWRLLQQLKSAITQRGFMPTAEEQPDIYRDAPPPGQDHQKQE